MTFLRFIFYLFTFISVLAGSGILVLVICLILRFPPLLAAVVLGCGLFAAFLKKASHRNNPATT